MYQDYINSYFSEMKEIIEKIDKEAIHKIIEILEEVRSNKGRLFILGVGGGAGHASHAVNDFRKLAGIEAYTPVDNVSELTARVNDEGWESVFVRWLEISSLSAKDAVMVFSVGGGHQEKNISMNIVDALNFSKKAGAKIIGIVGRDGGYTKKMADACVLVPVVNPETITPHTESFQAVIWHLIVSHPKFKTNKGKWETVR
ncbi:MAG: SIS domain-containing protein [Candidatus Magasanikbacteria bacterium]|nr:SIS domain-containing protein [Candidatus Magasanikbacteria bacterium]